jgi:predicted branched-subunit amino acid permease
MAVSVSFENATGVVSARGVRAGTRAMLPVILALAPFGLAIGAAAAEAELSNFVGWSTSWAIYAGSAQLAFIRATEAGTPTGIVILTVMAINLRLVFYSVSMAPHWATGTAKWKAFAAYLIVDPSVAVASKAYSGPMDADEKRGFWLGAGVTLWIGWVAINGVGVLWGDHVPDSFPHGLLLVLVLISLAGPRLTDKPAILGAATAAVVMWYGAALPSGVDVLVAGGAGVVTAFAVEEWLS